MSPLTTQPEPLTPPELSGFQVAPVEVPIQSTTPPTTIDDTFNYRAFKFNPSAKEFACEGKSQAASCEDRRDTIRDIMWLYAGDLAKECKKLCAKLTQDGKCNCQSLCDKVLSGLNVLGSDTLIEDKFEKQWNRFVRNMHAMLGHFWGAHGDVHPPSQFGLGYYGFKLLQAFSKVNFWAERVIFEPIFLSQYGASLDEILRKDSIEMLAQEEEKRARKTGLEYFLKDATCSNMGVKS